MAITFAHQREEWQDPAKPVYASDRFEWSDVDLFVIHYPGGDELPTGDPGDGDFARHLRASHNYYLSARGYSYGYSVVVDWRGESWEVRGEDFECAANKYVNGRSFAVQLVVDRQDPATPAQIAAVNVLYAQACASAGRALKILGHWQTTVKPYTSLTSPGTNCPGAGIFAQVQAGEFGLPKSPPPAPPDGGDEEVALSDEDVERIAHAVWTKHLFNFRAGEHQPAADLLGYAHAEAFDGAAQRVWDHPVRNYRVDQDQAARALLGFTHGEASDAAEGTAALVDGATAVVGGATTLAENVAKLVEDVAKLVELAEGPE
jgi:hypothetical protein